MANQRQVAVPQVVTIKIVEGTVDTLGEDDEVGPDLDERIEKILTAAIFQLREHLILNIFLHKVILDVTNLLIVVVSIALVDDDLIHLHELFV